MRQRFPWWFAGSLAVHAAWLVGLHDPPPCRSAGQQLDQLWLEELPAPEAESTPDPEPAERIPSPPVEVTKVTRVTKVTKVTKPAPPIPQRTSAAASAEAAAPGGPPTAAGVSEPDQGQGQGTLELAAGGGGVEPRVEPERPALPPQLSLWLAPMALQRMVIVRSPSALLAALPGYRDMLRGADLDPFMQLQALRVFLPGLSAARLALAGVHAQGEQAIVRSAERVAASRERLPQWRRSSELRATAWLDGSGYDRGLAVHGSAFLIGARQALPGLLGETAPWQQVDQLSKLRSGVVVVATLHDAASYLPSLRPCQLRSLQLSISAALRLQLQVEYESAAHAAQAASCLAAQPEAANQLRALRELLSRAIAAPSSSQSQLRTGVTYEEIAKLLDELTWSLRRVVRA